MNLTLEEISRAVGGTLQGPENVSVTGYSIDSRTIHAGDLFFAVKGPRFDGHQFVDQAFQKNAAAAIVEQGSLKPAANSGPLIRVASAVQALQALAQTVRRRWGKTIIGVTGSAGKTTTKEMIASALGKKFTVLRSVGNLNNEFGLPLCLLRIEPHQNIGVLEMGMSAKGEIRRLASIAEPNEGVVTNVNPVHLEFFKSVDEIAEAKAELIEGLHDPKVGYLNNDDFRVKAMAAKVSGRIVSYGIESDADFKAWGIQDLGLDGTAFTIHHADRDLPFVLPLLGRHNVTNAVAAIAVGATHDVPMEQIREAIAEMKPEKMRGHVIKFHEGFAVVDDCYNSNPRALSEMIRFVGKLDGYSRKILVAGEMLELGPQGPEMHRNCGREAAKAGLSTIVAVRGGAKEILQGAADAGMEDANLKFAADSIEAGDLVARMVRKGDVILVKGSRGVKLEQVINALRSAFSSSEA